MINNRFNVVYHLLYSIIFNVINKIKNMKQGKVIGYNNGINHQDFSGLSESEKNKAIMLLFNERDYQFSVDVIDGVDVHFITILKTGEKFNFIDYVKNY